MTLWTSYLVAVVAWSFHIIPLLNSAGKPAVGRVQKFADFLSSLATLTAGDVEWKIIGENKKQLAKLLERERCRDLLFKCRTAGYMAYELVCWPLDKCGGHPECQFLEYTNVNCRAEFPSKKRPSKVLRLGQDKRNECPELVPTVGGIPRRQRTDHSANGGRAARRPFSMTQSQPIPRLRVKDLDASIEDDLNTCRNTAGRNKCIKACDKSYNTLCIEDYTCTPTLLNAFALSCNNSCTFYFGK